MIRHRTLDAAYRSEYGTKCVATHFKYSKEAAEM